METAAILPMQTDGQSCFGRPLRSAEAGGFRLTESEYPPGAEIPPHAHETAQLCFALEGGFVDQHAGISLRCEPRTLILHPPGHVHADRMSDRGCRCLNISIPLAVLKQLPPNVRRIAATGAARCFAPKWRAFELLIEFKTGDGADALSIETMALSLLGELAGGPLMEIRRPPPPWLEGVRERMHDEFARPLDLCSLAKTAGVHRVHLARTFHAFYGCTIGQYVRQRRLEFACRELAANTPLNEIALRAGFTDQSHFTTTFRRLVGVTPGAFRARLDSH